MLQIINNLIIYALNDHEITVKNPGAPTFAQKRES